MNSRWRDALLRVDRWVSALENGLIVLSLSCLVVIGSAQIMLRNVLSTSLAWGDEFVRLLVLWLALIGAIVASREGRQIHIDLLSRLLPPRVAWIPDSICAGFTALVCGLLAWHSGRFVGDSRAYGDLLLGNQPAWVLQLILPLGFALMGLRYATRTLNTLSRH
ncbi:MAG TPA: TRAP transporter small permease [Gammaproteobacteria bacterium]|nr:TRAP transporter small permease [Gammaproteobacteria bacterium]